MNTGLGRRYDNKATKLCRMLSKATPEQRREVVNRILNAKEGDLIRIDTEWLSPNTSMGDLIKAGLRVRFMPMEEKQVDVVNNAPHYGGKDNPYEVVKVLEAWKLTDNSYLWNVIKYIARHRQKNGLQDLKKAQYYLNREIANQEEGQSANG